MSFYSYKNSGSTHCPCSLNGNEVLSGLNEKICIQVQRVYDSCLMQEQLKEQKVTLLSYEMCIRDRSIISGSSVRFLVIKGSLLI